VTHVQPYKYPIDKETTYAKLSKIIYAMLNYDQLATAFGMEMDSG
jgi:hypothetical protein